MRIVSATAEPVGAVAESYAASEPRSRTQARVPRSERALVRGALAGSEADLEALFRRHWPRAYRAAFLIVHDHAAAEDIAQQAFLAAIRRLDRFDRRRPFAPWLGAIVAISPTPVLTRVLEGNGLQQVSWSPDGRWLLVSWPAANQWVFVRVAGAPRIAAVCRIAQQLSTPGARQAFPALDGWCCTARGSAG
jgi:Sigma-70 region 2